MNQPKGNQVENASLMQLIQAMKINFAKDTHVADVVRVQLVQSSTCICQLLNQPQLVIECLFLDGLNLAKDDLALVLYTDTNVRGNLQRLEQSQTIQPVTTDQRHQLVNGIIIGKL